VSQGIDRFKPYPEYKDSGVEWFGRIPKHWNIRPFKALLQRNDSGVWGDDSNDDGTIVIRSTEQTVDGKWVIDAPAHRRLSIKEISNARLELGDLVVTKSSGSSLHIGKTSIVDELVASLNCCFSNFMQRLRISLPNIPRFYWYLLNCPTGREQFVVMASTTTGLGNLNRGILGSVIVPVLPIEEQNLITDFLDRQTTKIDALIAKKERLIELLQEKRTALITHAVTKGLNPAVPMKDSGDESFGATPHHWLFIPFSRVTISRCDGPFGSGLKSEHYRSSGVRVVRLQNIGRGEFINTDHAYIDEEHARELGDHSVVEDDVLVAGLGDDSHPVGRACVAPPGLPPAMVKADCFRFRLDRKLAFPHFVAHQLTATAVWAAGSLATGATRARMNLTTTSQRRLALPTVDEQAVIAKYIEVADAKCADISDVIRNGIDRLNDYRTALISAAVTGKIDVRKEKLL